MLGAALGAAASMAAKTAASAAKNTLKKKGSSGSGSSSRSSSSSSFGKSTAGGILKTAASIGNTAAGLVRKSTPTTGKTVADYQAAWKRAQAAGDTAGMQKAHAGAEALRRQQGLGGTYYDSDRNRRKTNDSTDYAALFQKYISEGDYDKAQQALTSRELKLGASGTRDSYQHIAQAELDALKARSMAGDYKSALNGSLTDYQGKADAIRSALDAKVEQNVSQLNAQRPLVQQAGAKANQAAQQNYYSTINPNGTGAEQRAALGLANSGLTESAQIAAANAYANAVNSNEQNVANQLAQIDLAIQNARLSGDIATAEQLQSYYDSVLSAGIQAAGNVLSAQQWALGNGQDARQQVYQNMLNQASLTGRFNDQQTLAGKQSELEFKSMDIANQRAALELMIQQKYGLDQAAAELYLTQMQGQGQNYENIYQALQNRYAGSMF